MILLIVCIFFFFFYGILIFYYKHHWETLPEFFPGNNSKNSLISVIIPARNEEKNISGVLNALKLQSYSLDFFEIIVVDDFSTDNTADIVKRFSLPNLHLIQPAVEIAASSKKKAIESAIAVAKGELIVTTDADCIPGPDWLLTVNDFYQQKQACFIAAPVKYNYDSTFLQRFQALDFLTLQGITAASVAANFHTMCNGANLSYAKQSFRNVKGFKGIDKVATGDDMLLMYKIWKQQPGKVFYLKSRKAIVTTEPMPTWKQFFMQRKRWASKSLVYDDFRIIAVLGFVYLFNCLFIALIVASLFKPQNGWYAAAYLFLKTIIEWPFVASVSRFYGERIRMIDFFIFQPLHIVYTVFVGALSQYGKYEWKGRSTK